MAGGEGVANDTLGAAGEVSTLAEFLRYMRDGVMRKADVPDAAAGRAGVKSGTSLGWLIRHLTVSERFWFCGIPVDDWALGSALPPGWTLDGLLADYRLAAQHADAVIAQWGADLDQTVTVPTEDRLRCTARWILQHMITETGRHAGHADILREQIDGTVGRSRRPQPRPHTTSDMNTRPQAPSGDNSDALACGDRLARGAVVVGWESVWNRSSWRPEWTSTARTPPGCTTTSSAEPTTSPSTAPRPSR